MLDTAAVFLDLETTGASADRDRITEIGLIEVRDGEYVDEWTTLVNPGFAIPQGIAALTGISDDMVAAAPTFAELAPELMQRLEGRLLIAHNARFDYQFLRAEFRRVGIAFASSVLCTVRLSRKLFPEHQRHNLDSLMERYDISCSARHRALPDAQVIWTFARELKRRVGADTLATAVEATVQLPVQTRGEIAQIVERLPSVPGAYVFYDEQGSALYVGKSSNLRSRVHADLANENERRALLENATLEWIETAGELGAALREMALIRSLAPRFNRSRAQSEAWTWDWTPEHGVQLAELTHESGAAREPRYGLFRSRSDATAALRGIARAQSLCAIACNLEAGPGPCSLHRAGTCKGVCIGQENPALHTARLVSALARLRLPAWPFPGPIAIRERDVARAISEAHVCDRWRYLGSARTDPELAELLDVNALPEFDIDHYRILSRHLSQPHPGTDILELERGAREVPQW